MPSQRTLAAIAFLLCAIFTGASYAGAPGSTTFTYQGRLDDTGVPANGVFDFEFRVFDAVTDGGQIGSTSLVSDMTVVEGLFTAVLDMGQIPWSTSSPRWLQVGVRPGAETGGYVSLAPRQAISGAPYSLSTRGIAIDANGRVGIGTENMINRLEVTNASGNSSIGIRSLGNAGAIATALNLSNDDPAATLAAMINMAGPSSSARISLPNNASAIAFSVPNGSERMRLTSSGLGLGTTAPSAKLHIEGGTVGTGHALNINDTLLVDGFTNFVGIGRDDPVTSAEVFGLHKDTGGFVGMYIDSGVSGEPFYGYSANGNARAYHYYSDGDNSWRLNLANLDRIIALSNGAVGIGGTPTFLFTVNGAAGKPGGGSWSSTSDARLKKNICNIERPLETFLNLHGVTFEYKDPGGINELHGTRLGMIAQDVEQVMPDWVDTDTRGYKTLTFRGFEALAVEALRELRAEKDAEIDALRKANARKDAELGELQDRLAALERVVTNLAENCEGKE